MKSITSIIDRIICGSDGKELEEYWKNKITNTNEQFRCDYCGKFYPIKDMHLSAEQDTKYENTVGTFGRPIIESSHKIYMVKLCSRCNRVHNIAGFFHFIITVIGIVLAVYLSYRENASYEHYIYPICIAVLITQGVRFVDWFFITLITGVRRKPGKA